MPTIAFDSKTIATLKSSPWFSELENQTFLELVPNFRCESWERHTNVMSPVNTEERFYVVLGGRIQIEALNANTGRSLTLFLLTVGDGHQLISLLDGKRHEVQAYTLDAVKVASAGLAKWRDWLDTYPSVRHAAFRNAAKLLRTLADLSEDLALHETSARLAHQLLRYVNPESGKVQLIGDLVQEDLARLIGSVRIVVNRLLNHYKREGIIHTGAGSIRVLDLERLLQMAERRLEGWSGHNSGD